MKQDRKAKHVDVNTFDSWANFTLRGFVGEKPGVYCHREDSWDDEAIDEKDDVDGGLKNTN